MTFLASPSENENSKKQIQDSSNMN